MKTLGVIAALAQAGISARAQIQPVLHLSFDNVSGSTVINDGSGGSTMNGTLTGTATIASGGMFGGNCLQISGANDKAGYCQIASSVVPLSVGAGDNWTVAMWIKTTTAGAAYAYQGDGGWTGTYPTAGDTMLYLNNGGFSSSGTQAGGVRWGQGNETGGASLNDGVWHDVVMTCNGTTKSLYVDGNLSSLTTDQWSAAGLGNQFWIGGSADTGDGSANLNGYVDEVYVFNQTLNQSQIQSLDTTNVVPEPSTMALAGLGGLAFLFLRQRKA